MIDCFDYCCFVRASGVPVEVYEESDIRSDDLYSNSSSTDTLVFSGLALFDPKPKGQTPNSTVRAKTTHDIISYDVAFYFCPTDFIPSECQYIVFDGQKYTVEYIEVAKAPHAITSFAYCNACS